MDGGFIYLLHGLADLPEFKANLGGLARAPESSASAACSAPIHQSIQLQQLLAYRRQRRLYFLMLIFISGLFLFLPNLNKAIGFALVGRRAGMELAPSGNGPERRGGSGIEKTQA